MNTNLKVINITKIYPGCIANKNIWTLTDGSQGMISQVNGLAKNFSNRIHNIQTELIFPWSVITSQVPSFFCLVSVTTVLV